MKENLMQFEYEFSALAAERRKQIIQIQESADMVY